MPTGQQKFYGVRRPIKRLRGPKGNLRNSVAKRAAARVLAAQTVKADGSFEDDRGVKGHVKPVGGIRGRNELHYELTKENTLKGGFRQEGKHLVTFVVEHGSPLELMITAVVEDFDDGSSPAHAKQMAKNVTAFVKQLREKDALIRHETISANADGNPDELTQEELDALPDPSHTSNGTVMRSIDEIADEFKIDRSTVSRRISNDKMLGFRGVKNKMKIPLSQFVGGAVMPGIAETINVFEGNHSAAWQFLVSNTFYGDDLERPIDRMIAAAGKASGASVIAEIVARARADYEGAYL